MLKRLTAVVCFMIFLSASSLAQEVDNCETTLNKAIEEFNAGHFNSISSMLNECLGKFSREQRERAYMLLTQTYLLLDDPIGAERSYLAVLQANPEFIADENRDPIDVVYLSKKFTATPIFSWYLNIGTNISSIKELNSWTTSTGDYQSKKYSLRPGLQLGGGLEYNFNDNIIAVAELNYAFTSFKVLQLYDGNNKKIAIDKQNWFKIPVMVRYSFKNTGKIRPYGYLGYSFNFLVKDVINETLENDGNFTTRESPNIKFTNSRKQFNRSFLFGGGVKYKFGLDYFFADVRFALGMTNLSKRDTRYGITDEDKQYKFDYGYLEDDFRMNNIYLSFGFVHPLYKPRKLKKARTKSVLRKIGKQDQDDQN